MRRVTARRIFAVSLLLSRLALADVAQQPAAAPHAAKPMTAVSMSMVSMSMAGMSMSGMAMARMPCPGREASRAANPHGAAEQGSCCKSAHCPCLTAPPLAAALQLPALSDARYGDIVSLAVQRASSRQSLVFRPPI